MFKWRLLLIARDKSDFVLSPHVLPVDGRWKQPYSVPHNMSWMVKQWTEQQIEELEWKASSCETEASQKV